MEQLAPPTVTDTADISLPMSLTVKVSGSPPGVSNCGLSPALPHRLEMDGAICLKALVLDVSSPRWMVILPSRPLKLASMRVWVYTVGTRMSVTSSPPDSYVTSTVPWVPKLEPSMMRYRELDVAPASGMTVSMTGSR